MNTARKRKENELKEKMGFKRICEYYDKKQWVRPLKEKTEEDKKYILAWIFSKLTDEEIEELTKKYC